MAQQPTSQSVSMQGKTVVVTGATRGIGFETTRGLAALGARVVMISRDARRTEEQAAVIRTATGNTAVETLQADLSVQADVRRVAGEILDRCPRIDVLVNNAGAVFSSRKETVDGLEMTFALNHMNYFLLTNLLLDRLKASAPARIVNVASAAHTMGKIKFDDLQHARSYSGFSAYGDSKLMNILFTYELSRRLSGTGVTANCLHPGFVASGFGKNDSPLMKAGIALMRPFQISAVKGAQTSIYLASSPDVEGVTGKYFSNRRAVDSNKASYDIATAQRLWEETARIVGLPAESGAAVG